MIFEPPGARQRVEAIGPTEELPEVLQRAFAADGVHEPVAAPGPSDWLAVHREPGQTFHDFQRGHPHRPDTQRRIIYLQPLGEFPEPESPSPEQLRQYAAAFFQMEATALPPVSVGVGTFTTRTDARTERRQILTEDVLQWLKGKLPKGGFCLLAITLEDLYPAPTWNFVFGQAWPRERVGVYSFARYDPAFYEEGRGSHGRKALLRRSLKVLAHETGHMFGLAHCIYFRCVMNGSNHLEESDRRPQHLCPVCLRKLQFSIGFDVVRRYEALAQFAAQAGLEDEAEWLRGQLDRLQVHTH